MINEQMKSFYNLRLNLLVYLSICFFVLIPISKADYIWNETVSLPAGTGDATASAGSVGITFSDLDDLDIEETAGHSNSIQIKFSRPLGKVKLK